MGRKLAVVVGEKARITLESVFFRWFSQARERKDEEVELMLPSGEIVSAKGTLVGEPNLREHTSDYFYLEITPRCQLRCAECGAKDLVKHHNGANGIQYISDEFAIALAEAMAGNPYQRNRPFFYSGGEPLIKISQFWHIHSIFQDINKTDFTVVTNGLALPLNKSSLQGLVSSLGVGAVAMSYSPSHAAEYARLAKAGGMKEFIPANVQPELALAEKIRQIAPYFPESINFYVNVVARNQDGAKAADELMKYCDGKARVIVTELYGKREPCRQGEELAIRWNGDLYPHCYDIFNKTNPLGRIGVLVSK